MKLLKLTPLTPLLLRDTRPFDSGVSGAESLPFPLSSMTAGTVRSYLVKASGTSFPGELPHAEQAARQDQILTWQCRGPLLTVQGEWYLPAPLDLVSKEDGTEVTALRPLGNLAAGAGTNLPYGLVPFEAVDTKLYAPIPGYLPWRFYEKWLRSYRVEDMKSAWEARFESQEDKRTRVKINDETSSAEEGFLFNVLSRNFRQDLVKDEQPTVSRQASLVVQVSATAEAHQVPGTLPDSAVHRLGGGGGFVQVEQLPDTFPVPTDSLLGALSGAKRIRMLLATPAVFERGWLPDGLEQVNGALESSTLLPGVKLRLIAALVPRWQVMAGWDIARHQAKPLRRMVGSGAVYSFEVLAGGENLIQAVAAQWLQSICTNAEVRRDGFGMVTWGIG